MLLKHVQIVHLRNSEDLRRKKKKKEKRKERLSKKS